MIRTAHKKPYYIRCVNRGYRKYISTITVSEDRIEDFLNFMPKPHSNTASPLLFIMAAAFSLLFHKMSAILVMLRVSLPLLLANRLARFL